MADEKNLVKKSLHKFLDEGISTFVTYDSKESEIKNIIENASIAPSTILSAGTTTFQLYLGGQLLTGIDSSSLVGRQLEVDFDSDLITDWDDLTSTITISNGFTTEITEFDRMSVGNDSLIYMLRLHGFSTDNNNLCFSEEIDRWDLIIKVKDDSNKDKIDAIWNNIVNLIKSNYMNFDIYADDLITKIGSGKIFNYKNEGEIDVTNDFQSYLGTFQVRYYINYLK